MESSNRVVSGCGFHHVAIRVHDFDRSVNFYKAIGLTEALAWGEGDSRGILLDTGDGNYIEIFAGGKPDAKPQWGEGAAWIHLALRTTDIESATQKAVAAGAILSRPPSDITIGKAGSRQVPVRVSFVHGPGGETLEFFQSTEL